MASQRLVSGSCAVTDGAGVDIDCRMAATVGGDSAGAAHVRPAAVTDGLSVTGLDLADLGL